MTFEDWRVKFGRDNYTLEGHEHAMARSAFDAGVAEGLRRAAEKEARKKPTGLITNDELLPRDSED